MWRRGGLHFLVIVAAIELIAADFEVLSMQAASK
jgi:hypothetical protein